MVTARRLTVVVLLCSIGVTLPAQRRNPWTGYVEFPSGTTVAPVPVPGSPECQVSIEFWQNGSFFAEPGDYALRLYRDRPMKAGTPASAEAGSANFVDLMWVRTIVAAALQNSEDMRTKTKDACRIAGGASGIQIRLVRDDPDVDVANAQVGANLVFIDIADVQRLLSSTELYVGVPDSARDKLLDQYVKTAVKDAGPALVFGLIAHEIDHLREVGDGAHDDPHSFLADDQQGGAVRDENQVMRELGFAVQRAKYADTRLAGGEFQPVIPYQVRGVDATLYFLPDKALLPATTPGTVSPMERRFTSGGLGDTPDTCCGCDGAGGGGCSESTSWTATVPLSALIGGRSMGMTSIDPVNRARAGNGSQAMGGSVLQYANDDLVLARQEPPRMPALLASVFVRQARGAANAAPMVLFTSLGVSSGPAFEMTVLSASTGPIRLKGDGFVLEPVPGVRPQDVQRELQRLGGRRTTATIAAYCLEMAKPAPTKGMVYRLAPASTTRGNGEYVGPVMRASRHLKDAGVLHPDSDPEEYFHFLRQWALWTIEQNWRTEAQFTTALLAHTRKTFADGRQAFTPQIEQAIRRIAPGRWRDITSVLGAAEGLRLR